MRADRLAHGAQPSRSFPPPSWLPLARGLTCSPSPAGSARRPPRHRCPGHGPGCEQNQVRLGVGAPREVPMHREEVVERIRLETERAGPEQGTAAPPHWQVPPDVAAGHTATGRAATCEGAQTHPPGGEPPPLAVKHRGTVWEHLFAGELAARAISREHRCGGGPRARAEPPGLPVMKLSTTTIPAFSPNTTAGTQRSRRFPGTRAGRGHHAR
jgi:hypothetical protein